jgi:hypothetical protein
MRRAVKRSVVILIVAGVLVITSTVGLFIWSWPHHAEGGAAAASFISKQTGRPARVVECLAGHAGKQCIVTVKRSALAAASSRRFACRYWIVKLVPRSEPRILRTSVGRC